MIDQRVPAWRFDVTVTYPGDQPVTSSNPTLERAAEIMLWVIDSPTNLAPEVSIKRVMTLTHQRTRWTRMAGRPGPATRRPLRRQSRATSGPPNRRG